MGLKNLVNYGVGKPFLKFKLPNLKDKQIDISNFRGKIILVDFWASWCKPCREKHPELIELKNKYGKKIFDIVSISIDNKKENWIKVVERDNIKWTNLLDENKVVSNELGIKAIQYHLII